MALVANFIRQDKEIARIHDRIDAHVASFDIGQERLLQIDTFGRGSRKNPGKISQSLQLDRQSAESLFAILKETYGFK
ncbi:methionyl-tRNA formyltransferase [Xanthobacter sp. KR7-65]|uniref:methionyl-tRNA formyltransferase n=1 Tax=Xanthobacter sp. KR7-65 TaxID=3156612 RepID=UPI0032B4DC07